MEKIEPKYTFYETKISELKDLIIMIEDLLIDKNSNKFKNTFSSFYKNYSHRDEFSLLNNLLSIIVFEFNEKEPKKYILNFLKLLEDNYDFLYWQQNELNKLKFVNMYFKIKNKEYKLIDLPTNFLGKGEKQIVLKGFCLKELEQSFKNVTLDQIEEFVKSKQFIPFSILLKATNEKFKPITVSETVKIQKIMENEILPSNVLKNYKNDNDFLKVYNEIFTSKKLTYDFSLILDDVVGQIMKDSVKLNFWYNDIFSNPIKHYSKEKNHYITETTKKLILSVFIEQKNELEFIQNAYHPIFIYNNKNISLKEFYDTYDITNFEILPDEKNFEEIKRMC